MLAGPFSNLISCFFAIVLSGFCFGQDLATYKSGTFTSGSDNIDYRILPPKEFSPDKAYPLIIFLHGSGERGTDNELQLKHGGTFFASDSIRTKYPAFVVFPQCKPNMRWHNVEYDLSDPDTEFIFPRKPGTNLQLELVEGMIEMLIDRYPIDGERLYAAGLSMGGMGTFELIARNPGKFNSAFAICGGAHPELVNKLKHTRWWIFHGAEDDVIPVWASKQVANALRITGADAKLTIYPGVKHDSWNNALSEPGLMQWLFDHKY